VNYELTFKKNYIPNLQNYFSETIDRKSELLKSIVTPIGNSDFKCVREGAIEKVTITWVRYTSKLNSKKGRFGIRKRHRKTCQYTLQIN
jgi:hypothetical protein